MNAEAQQELQALKAQQERIEAMFKAMDADADGRVSKPEFGRYLTSDRSGWPLAEVHPSSTEQENEIVAFWFRKITKSRDDSFNKLELQAFLQYVASEHHAEALYADLLLELYDDNYDKELSRSEYSKMVHGITGRVPTTAALRNVGEKVTREDLISLIRSAGCDFRKLDYLAGKEGKASSSADSGDATTLILVGVVAVALGAVVYWKLRK